MSAHLASAAGCRALDAAVIEGLGLPGIALMEVASRGVALAILAQFPAEAARGVLVVCGGGNNGGDGWGTARWLHLRGLPVQVWSVGESAGDAARMRDVAIRAGVPVVPGPTPGCGLVVDAVFGTGLARPVTGAAAEVLRAIDGLGAPVVAVDLPSGLCADTGRVLGAATTAALTVTFGRLKPAFFTRGAARCGQVELVDIGVHPTDHSAGELADPRALALRWPGRAAWAHKNAVGHLAVIAGSERMAGAAVLCCLGALRAGVGLVTLYTPPEALPRLGGLPAAVMVRSTSVRAALEFAPRDHDAVAVGPGLGGGRPLTVEVRDALAALASADVRAVFDADALLPIGAVWSDEVVRTPHPGEAGRLLGTDAAAVEADRFGTARALAQQGGVALLKGRHTLVAADGRLSVNPTGAPSLATAGSGDVLTGLIGGLLARGVGAWDAARLGAWVHGRAGERLSAQRAEGWTAEDVAGALPGAVEDLRAAGG